MNITPSISDEKIWNYNYIKRDSSEKGAVSFFVINRGGKFNRKELFSQLLELNCGDVNFVESPQFTFDAHDLSKDFKKINFLNFQNKLTWGEIINVIVNEAQSEFIFILWSDMKLTSPSLFLRNLNLAINQDHLYQVPLLLNMDNQEIPSIQVPVMIKRKLKIIPLSSPKIRSDCIFPYDFCGLINKSAFQAIHGFDVNIKTPFWQKMDFGFRAYLWGYKIVYQSGIKLSYTSEQNPENTTPDKGYKFFYLKNIFVKLKNKKAQLDLWAFFRYLIKSNSGPYYSFVEFKQIKEWVGTNKKKFLKDAKTLIEQWVIRE